MSANDYHNLGQGQRLRGQQPGFDSRHQPEDVSSAPSLPPLKYSTVSIDMARHSNSPVSPPYDSTPLYKLPSRDSDGQVYEFSLNNRDAPTDYPDGHNAAIYGKSRRQHSDEIPLRENPQHKFGDKGLQLDSRLAREEGSAHDADAARRQKSRRHESLKSKKSFWRDTTWVVYIMTLVQLTVFVVELVRNSILTNTPIAIKPQFNPMIGPSFYVLVNMGARYQPCMRVIDDVPVDRQWPCPNLTSVVENTPGYYNNCTLSEFCGFSDFGDEPNQWWRFITPMFLHAGIIHIGFNMLLQLTLGREIEQIIGSIRFLIVYLSSGIFGFVLGGNFAPNGLASTGASGALFGILAINLLDLLYTWNERVSPKKELAFIILDIVVSFVLGLLPGLDNFAHIGGFLMGLVLGVCLLHTPNLLRKERIRIKPSSVSEDVANTKRRKARAKKVSYKSFAKDPSGFFKDRKLMWWSWWLLRAAAFIGVLAAFIVLLNNFYRYHRDCHWCRYFTCIDVNNWCDQGNLRDQMRPNL